MEYTNEFLARVYGAYIGCDVEYQGRDGRPDKHFIDTTKDDYNFKFRLTGFKGQDVLGDIILNTGEVISDEVEAGAKECKLLLMPMYDMTDEDAIEVAKMFGYKIKKGTILPDEVETKADLARVGKSLVQSFLRNAVTDTYLVWQPIIDKLRELGYDCGYGSVTSLIKAGIAIKKQKP